MKLWTEIGNRMNFRRIALDMLHTMRIMVRPDELFATAPLIREFVLQRSLICPFKESKLANHVDLWFTEWLLA